MPARPRRTRANFLVPQDDDRLWRYVNPVRLVSMLDKRALHFARADTFEDPYEGSATRRPNPIVYDDGHGGWRVATPEEQAEHDQFTAQFRNEKVRKTSWQQRRESWAVKLVCRHA